ncbi:MULTISPECIES: sigma-54 dependent transcriptional regulator [Zoogloea]|jgi:DNA-binding NtrC family response regulator|uniref:sigma-54-dependent transcriptional regulator n=1 Tax=Zoogloea TaxID=349 RepID=UPI00258D1708|nr:MULTISPECIES: sigma-54 dependent transcriptional regulator [Zoogloea]MDD2670272.1 sigma-54 dependent transcriptional regulator [Zoogloea sp.]MDY0035953.1 sigma-54 dependent transcriptional regulator [Zoogloea oleivorans]
MGDAAPASTATSTDPAKAAWANHAVLVVDDEAGMRSFLERALVNRGCTVAVAGSAEEGATHLAVRHFDLIVLDISLPGKSGLAWLHELRDSGFAGEVILITAFADMETAIDALRAGASDFILKPFRLDQLLNALQRCFERARLATENYVLRRQVADLAGGVDGLVGRSAAIQNLGTLIRRIAPLPSTVLILGESGVGKEVAARALHQMSLRAERPFVPVNCAAISAELIESELFGHTKGAFTGARENHKGLFFYANGGTLFLDEIGELPLMLQTKLLRALEERCIRPVGASRELPVDVRVIAATNRDLRSEVAEGRFRQDLFYRLDVMSLEIPALRQRPEDVPVLAAHFNSLLALRLGLPPLAITPAVAARLSAYAWPGNVRELRNLVERSLILGSFPAEDSAGGPLGGESLPLSLAEVEKRHILAVLERCEGKRLNAAQLLGVSRKTLDRKCAEWGENAG